MYLQHFGLNERPFSLNPDPAFLYRSRKHGMALTMLEYGLMSNAPIALITGEIGAGKTTIIRQILMQIEESARVGLISNTHKSFGNLMQWIASAFDIELDIESKARLHREFTKFLIGQYAAGRRVVLIIDEAQNLDVEYLEELRVLSNINAEKDVLFQLVLVGQPELRETLRLPAMEQFAQRIAVDFHLQALNLRETREYIQYRTTIAGSKKALFQSDAMIAIYQYADGVPRLINSLCDTALVYTFAEGRSRVSARIVHGLVAEKRELGLFGAGKASYSSHGQ